VVIVSTQFGSLCDGDYEFNTDVHTVTLSTNYDATEKLKLNVTAMYNDAKAESSNVQLGPLSNATNDYVVLSIYDTGNLAKWKTYSDLRYKQAEMNLGGTYNFTPALYLTAQAGAQWFIDDQPYVYGDQDGTAYSGSLGMGYKF